MTNKKCPKCDNTLEESISYIRGNKSSDGYKCKNSKCDVGWLSFQEYHNSVDN